MACVPALLNSTSWTPAARASTSADGERQMLAVQTNRTFTAVDVSGLAQAASTSPRASAMVRPVVSTRTSASCGSSYGEEMPVNSGISPARALA